MEKLNDQLGSYLKFFEHRVSEWADVVKALGKIYETLAQFPQNAQITVFAELTQRLGQCLNPELQQGIHIKALEVYEQLLRIVAYDLPRYIDDLFIPLLPLFQHASIYVKIRFLNVMDKVMELDISDAYTAPLMASLLSARLAEGDDISKRAEKILAQLEARDSNYQRKLFEIASVRGAARANALGSLIARNDLNREYLGYALCILQNGDETEVRIALDIVFKMCSFSAESIGDCYSICYKLLLLFTKDYSVVRRIHDWIYAADPELYSRVLLKCLIDYSQNNTVDAAFIDGILQEVSSKDEFLDVLLAGSYYILKSIFSKGHFDDSLEIKKITGYMNYEQYFYVFFYRQLASLLLHGRPVVGDDFVYSRILLSKQEIFELYDIIFYLNQKIVPQAGQRLQQQQIKETVFDIYGDQIFNIDSEITSVYVEMLIILCYNLMSDLSHIKDSQVLSVLHQLYDISDKQCLIEKLEQTEWNNLSIIKNAEDKSFSWYLFNLLVFEKDLCYNKSFMYFLKKINMHLSRQFTGDAWFKQIICNMIGINTCESFECVSATAPVILDISLRKFSVDYVHSVLKSSTQAAKQIAVFFEKHQNIVNFLVIHLFDEIVPGAQIAYDSLCKLCALKNCQAFSQALETHLASTIISAGEGYLEMVRKFILLWQHAAEAYNYSHLFYQILMLHIEMIYQESTEEQVRVHVESFIRSCFDLDKWCLSLLDAILDTIEQGPKLKNGDDNFLHLVKRTDKEYICDIPRCNYVFKLFVLLYQLGYESFILALSQIAPSKIIMQLVKNEFLYGTDSNTSYLDYIIDFALIFLVVRDAVDPILLKNSAQFIDQMFYILKQTMVKSVNLLNAVNRIQKKISNIIIKALVDRPQNRFLQQITLSMLDASCCLINSADDLGIDIGVYKEHSYCRLPTFVQQFLGNQCLSKLIATIYAVDMNMIQFFSHVLDLLGVLQNDLTLADAYTYCNDYPYFTTKRKYQNELNAAFFKNLPENLDMIKETDKAESRMARKYEDYIKKLKGGELEQLDSDSLVPAPIRFLPSVFLAEQLVHQTMLMLSGGLVAEMSLSQALSLSNLIYLCSIHVFIGYTQYEQLVIPAKFKTDERPKGMPSQSKDIQISQMSAKSRGDLSMAFMIKPFLQLIGLILKCTQLNTLSISEQIRSNIFSSVTLIENYSPFLFVLIFSQIYTYDHEHTYPLVFNPIKQALKADQLLKMAAQINNSYIALSKYVDGEPEGNFHYQLFELSPASALHNILTDCIINFNFYSVLDMSLYRLMSGIDHSDAHVIHDAFSQLANVLLSQSPVFNCDNAQIVFFEPVYGSQLNMISQVKLLQAMSQILTSGLIDAAFSRNEFSVVCQWISHIIPTTFKAYLNIMLQGNIQAPAYFCKYNSEHTTVQYISDTLFDCVTCLIQQVGRYQPYYHYPFEIDEYWGPLISKQPLDLVRPPVYHPDVVSFASVIPILFNLLTQFPSLKSRILELLQQFMNLDVQRQVYVLQRPVIDFLVGNGTILSREAVEIISYNKYALIALRGCQTLDSAAAEFLAQAKLKNTSTAKLLIEAYCISYGCFAQSVQQVLQKIMVRIRNIDREDDMSLQAALLVVSAVIYTLQQSQLQPMWTNIIQLLSALYKRKIDGVAAVNWLLSQKFEDNSVYVRFMSVEKVEFQFWFYEQLSILWKQLK